MTKIIKKIYLILIFCLPLVFSFSTSELFEFPKMILVYFFTCLILTLHLANHFFNASPFFKKTPLTIPLYLYLFSQIISTIFSIDTHMSFWGYYSRFNGSLLSTLSYIVLYQILVIYIDKDFTQKFIKTTLVSCFFVCLYAIAQHFGIDKNTWVQDVQSRVFSTFGQPNWLSAYLVICLSLLLGQIHHNRSNNLVTNYLLLVIIFTSLLFTKSKSGIIATSIPLLFFLAKNLKSPKIFIPFIFLLIIPILVFDNPIKDFLLPSTISQNAPTTTDSAPLNITSSKDIRLIVWQGAFDVFKKFPLTGSGVETFAISYYWTRPIAHNLTSEWDFLYNKAHNEFLNTAANTGTFGIFTYLVVIISIIVTLWSTPFVLLAFLTILITNFAGFSVVATSLYFFLLPTLSIDSKPTQSQTRPKKILFFICLPFLLFLYFSVFSIFIADIKYAQSKQIYQTNLATSLKYINTSIKLRPKEPEYLIHYADVLSQIAISQNDTNFIQPAINALSIAEKISPFHLNYLKKSTQILFNLSALNKIYLDIGIETIKKATVLAPTDAKSFFILGQLYQAKKDFDLAKQSYQKAVDLKSNYDHAYFALAQIYYADTNYQKALNNFKAALTINPKNQDAKDYINKINSRIEDH